MPAGILNRDLYVNGVLTTTTELRNKLLGRNLPEPIPNSLRATEFASYFGSLGQVVSIPNPLTGEYIPKVGDGEYPLEDISNEKREEQLLLNIHNAANEEEYVQYNYSVPPTPFPYLPDPYGKYYDASNIRSNYPVSLNLDRFKLLATGDKVGRRDPYQVIQTNDVTTNTESFLGIIGMEQLNTSILNRKAQIIESEFIQPNKTLSALKNGANVDSYDITIPKDKVDKTVTFINYLDGSQTPYSQLPNEAVGWQEYSKPKGDTENVMDILGSLGVKSDTALSTEARNNELLSRTSDGQKLLLYTNLSMNKFIPNYEDPRLSSLLGADAPKSRYYIGDDRSTNRGDTLTKVFKSEQFNDSEPNKELKTTVEDAFFWKLDGEEFNPNTLLGKTQKLVNDNSDRVFINQTDKFFKDTTADKYISRGSAIKSNNDDATSFFRTWTVEDNYSYEKAIKKSGLQFKRGSIGRDKASLSVLQANGMVKTHPTSLDKVKGNPKKFMFSIENLAWADNFQELPPCEVGNGDPISGNKGRIMWFAPYDLQFDENVSANWTATEFIGRGEPMYTYNNTKRSGQLRFKMVVDHPSVINEFRGRQSDLIEKLFAGGRTVDEFMQDANFTNTIDINTRRAIENGLNKLKRQATARPNVDTQEVTIKFQKNSSAIVNSSGVNNDWFNGESDGTFKSKATQSDLTVVYIDAYGSIFEETFNGTLDPNNNKDKKALEELATLLATDRYNAVKEKVIAWGVDEKNIKENIKGSNGTNKKELQAADARVDVKILFEPRNVESANQTNTDDLQIDPERLSNLTIDECNFFDIVDESYPNYFKTISEKIKYFQPGFHSMTPEGLNSRMTFLHQCTRQGPSVYDKGDEVKPQNLAFGRPPVCILRIGDFFHSKVIINSLSINHGGGGSIQWDLNPEGIGVQPMVVDVNLSIDIVGGQALSGPINRIQNALSFNYYANTEFYDKRADSLKIDQGGGKIINGEKPTQVKAPKTANVTDTTDQGVKPDGIETNIAAFDLLDIDDIETIEEDDEEPIIEDI